GAPPLAGGGPRWRAVDRKGAEIGEVELAQELAAVGMRARTHALGLARGECTDGWHGAPVLVEKLLRRVAPHPVLQRRQVFGILACRRQRYLMSAPCPLDLLAVDDVWARPALRRAQDDGRPAGATSGAVPARLALEPANVGIGVIHRRCQRLMHMRGLVAGHEDRAMPVAPQ